MSRSFDFHIIDWKKNFLDYTYIFWSGGGLTLADIMEKTIFPDTKDPGIGHLQ